MAEADRHPLAGGSSPSTNLIFLWAALALDGAFLTAVIPALLPFHPVDPLWILPASHILLQQAVLPLIGICLLLVAARRHPDDDIVRSWLLASRRLSVAAALGLLLLLPLQVLATVLALQGPDQQLQRNVEAMQTLRREMTVRPSLQPSGQQVDGLLNPAWLPEAARLPDVTRPSAPQTPPALFVPGLMERPQGPADRSRFAIIADLDRAVAIRAPLALQQRVQSVNRRGLSLLMGLIQNALLLPAYAAVALISPRSGSLLQELIDSWGQARQDLIKARRQQRTERLNQQRPGVRQPGHRGRQHRAGRPVRFEEERDLELIEAARLMRRYRRELLDDEPPVDAVADPAGDPGARQDGQSDGRSADRGTASAAESAPPPEPPRG